MRAVTSRLIVILVVVLLAVPAAGHVQGTSDREPPEYTAPPPSEPVDHGTPRPFCPNNETYADWREGQTVEGIDIEPDPSCKPDNPKTVAAVTMGTNNMPRMWRMETGLAEDAVTKCCDKDGDGDPDVINISLEVAEINGKPAPEADDSTILNTNQEIAPGIAPTFWTFAPKSFGMATEGGPASNVIRYPSPAIRIEQDDTVRVTLENTHYMPHTIHFHGADHPFMSGGEGNDGVPQTSEEPVDPGEQRTYELEPRRAGSFFYHCHVQPQNHILMGLQGLFVVEEEADNNTLQTFNIGNGKVRHPSQTSEQRYDQEYDMLYTDIDEDLHSIPKESNDPRVISELINRRYDVTDRDPDYYTLNGKSFPFTFRESQIITGQNEETKLRILNAGSEDVDLHTHGHTMNVTHLDGNDAPDGLRRDVVKIGAAQRVDAVLNTTDDGHNSYGEGIWFTHSHKEESVTSDGIAPGGSVTGITYESYLQSNGMPDAHGVSWEPYFTESYYERDVPVWQQYSPVSLFGSIEQLPPSNIHLLLFALAGLLLGAVVSVWVMRG
jgi:FtsP/CotA-like multicopper oxidase with cupredoxin domain